MDAQALSRDGGVSCAPVSGWRTGLLASACQGPTVLALLSILFAIAGLVLLFGRFIVNDEGLLTHVFSRWLVLDPVPVLFFQKVGPITPLIFTIPSLAGVEPMLVAHVLLATMVGPMLAAVAGALGIRLPNLVPLIVFVSPVFLFGAAAGIPNVDGVVATSLFLYLAVARRRYWLAGFVLGCLPWVRHELALFSLLMWCHAVFFERRRGVALGALIFPMLYWTCGVGYHGDLLWLVHFPPATILPMPGNPIWPMQRIGFEFFLPTQLLVTPAIGFALAVRFRSLTSIERALFVFVVTSIVLLSLLPALRLGNFGPSARYSMQSLPALALFAARGVESWLEGERPPWRLLLLPVMLAGIWALSAGPPRAVALPILGAYLAVVVLVTLGWARLAVGALGLVVCVGLGLPRDELTTPSYFQPVLAWLRQHPEEVRDATIYTNSNVMPFAIATSREGPERHVRFIVAPDNLWEIRELSNAENGQRAALLRLAATEFFGPSVLWNDISPDTIPSSSLLVLRHDPRLASVMPQAVWAGRLEEVARGRWFTIARLVPAGAVPVHPPAFDGEVPALGTGAAP